MSRTTSKFPNSNFLSALRSAKEKTQTRQAAEKLPENKEAIEKAYPLPARDVILPTEAKRPDPVNNHVAKFVRGEVDTPTPPKPVSLGGLKSFVAASAASAAEKKKSLTAKEKALIPSPVLRPQGKTAKENVAKKEARSQFWGTGFTKKLGRKLEADTRRRIKEEEALQDPEKALEKITSKAEEIFDLPPVIDPRTIDADAEKAVPEIIWDEYQLAALEGLRRQRFACLIGAAGTGKTTVTKQIVSEIEAFLPTISLNSTRVEKDKRSKDQFVPSIAFVSFMGRAVQQTKRVLPREYWPMCATIHATLGYMPTYEPYFDKKNSVWKDKLVFRPTFTAANKLPYKFVIVDEAGTVPIYLWNELLAALPSDCRIILIGDINQLPPVQGRSVLGFAMINWPTYTLEKIHRQAADNPIIANVHLILKGLLPKKDAKRFHIKYLPSGSIAARNTILQTVKHLHEVGLFDPFKDALIVPQNKGQLGQKELNEHLVLYFNPPRDDRIEGKRVLIKTGAGQVHYAVGDKIMLLQNDRRRGLTNGMIGKVVSININGQWRAKRGTMLDGMGADAMFDFDEEEHGEEFDALVAENAGTRNGDSEFADERLPGENGEDEETQRQATHVMTVLFDNGTPEGEEVPFATAGQYATCTLAYAFTCHKSQGGEYRHVIIAAHSANSIMLSREWLNTAITRAREKVIFMINERGLEIALKNQRISGKTVKEKAEQFIALQDKKDTTLPNLPKPEEV